jgi:hypothetical protein
MAFRCSFFFTQQGDLLSGGSINFYNQQGDQSAVVTAARNLLAALYSLTGLGCNWPNARIADLQNFRSVVIIKNTRTSVPGGTNADADFINTAGLLKVRGPGAYVVNQWMRGLTDGCFRQDGRWDPDGFTTGAFGPFHDQLVSSGNGWCIRAQNKATPKKLITAVTLTGQVTIPAHGYTGTPKIRISRTGGMPGLNKVWITTVVDANNLQLVAIPVGGFTGGYTKPGTAQLQDAVFLAITDAQIVRATSHRTGRPFGQSSGRRRTRAR